MSGHNLCDGYEGYENSQVHRIAESSAQLRLARPSGALDVVPGKLCAVNCMEFGCQAGDRGGVV